jgi:toxin ParE1/3/4
VKPHAFHPGAEEDFLNALAYYRDESAVQAGRLYDEIMRLVGEVCRTPHSYRLIDPPVRRHMGRNFPYAILYVEKPDRVLVLAVAHFKRRPGYWKSRLS